MTIYQALILAFWVALIVCWLIMAAGAKRTIGGWVWRRELALRLAIFVLIAIALRSPAFRRDILDVQLRFSEVTPVLGIAGVMLCGAGVGFAIWARVNLGRNWGMPMSRKEDPELVTTGAYSLVRHPIYGGILVAMLGSVIAVSVFWALALIVFGAYFIYSARREEKLMIAQFPEQYCEYMKRTKMLLPYMV